MIRKALLSVSAAFLAAATPGNSPLDLCANTTVAICGAGNVCCLCVVGDPTSCSFSCRDAERQCQPCPPCGPKGWSAHEYVTEILAPGASLVVGGTEVWLVVGFGEIAGVRVR